MSTSLDQILDAKREEVARRQQLVPLDALRETITTLGRPRNFFNAVARKPTGARAINLIAEISSTALPAGTSFDPVPLARAAAEAGADALSVWTDQARFRGELSHIHAVRDAVRLPVLRKDFIIDPYQVHEARAAGADAVLLIAEALETSRMIDLQILATELNMTCVIEVHDLDNLMRVRDAVIGFPHRTYSLLAIHNRSLNAAETNLGTTLRMAELVEDRDVLISEEGIENRDDIAKLAAAGVRAGLIVLSGEAPAISRTLELFAPG